MSGHYLDCYLYSSIHQRGLDHVERGRQICCRANTRRRVRLQTDEQASASMWVLVALYTLRGQVGRLAFSDYQVNRINGES